MAAPFGLRHPSHHGRSGCRLHTKDFVKHTSVPVSLLGSRNVVAPFGLRVGKALVRNSSLGSVFQSVNPRVSDTVRELFLLSPQNLIWQVRLDVWLVGCVESLSQDVLLDLSLGWLDQFVLWVDVHAHFQKALVQEGDSGLQAPSHGRLVCSQTVGVVQVLDSLDALLVELRGGRSVGEIQVATKDFVGALTRKNHLHPLGLDFSGQQVHRRGRSDSCDVVGLQVGDDVAQSVQTLLQGEGVRVVDGADEMSDFFGGHQVGGARGDSDGVSGSDDSVLALVVQHPGEHAVQVLGGVEVVFAVQGNDGLTVAQRLELVVGKLASQLDVVVDFAVDGQEVVVVGRGDGAGAAVQADNGQSFVTQDGVVADYVTRPVWATMSDPFGVLQRLGLEAFHVRLSWQLAMSLQQLSTELHASYESHDYDKCQKILVPIKLELIKNNLLVPMASNTGTKDQINDLKIAQKILEIGALGSLWRNDYAGFENYYSLLKPFYDSSKIHAKRELNSASTKIISLYLLYLLSQGVISQFHVELENWTYFTQYDLEKDQYLQFPINLEKNLMEGNYIKIWNLLNDEGNLPCSEYKIFVPTLINALRFEIARSLEKTYESIPISNCKNLLYFPQEESDAKFVEILENDLDIHWQFKDGNVVFQNDQESDEMQFDNSNKIINNVLSYAEQIESII